MKCSGARDVVCRVTAALKREVEKLRRELAERDAVIADQKLTIERLKQEVAVLQGAVAMLMASRRGGVTVPTGQGLLFPDTSSLLATPLQPATAADAEPDDGGSEAGKGSATGARKKGTPRTPRKIDTTGLPVEERLHDVPEAQRIDAATGKPLVQIAEKVFDELDYQRARLLVIRHRQPIYDLPPEERAQREIAPVMADLPRRPLERCAASPRLLSWLLVQKFANHLPLHRQEQIFGRDGLRIPKQTLCDWTLGAGEALRPIADRLLQIVCSGVVLQLADTPVMCQAGRGEPNFRAYLWSLVRRPPHRRYRPRRRSIRTWQPLRAEVEQAGPISIAAALERLHPVVARTGRALRQAEKQERDRHGLMQPQWVHDGCLLGIEVSATGIDRAIRLFEGLFVAAEAFGGKIVEKDKSPAIRLLGDRVKFHLRERPRMRRLTAEERKDRWAGRISWEGSGVFELSVSTDDELGSQQRWRDGRKGQLEDRLQRILLDTIEAIQAGRRWRRAAPARELERQRQLEEERQRQIEQLRRDEERRRERERVTFLTKLASQHAEAMQLRDFLAACKEVPDRDAAADRWIAWGEQVLAGIDPLADGLAPILAARPSYGPPLFAAITCWRQSESDPPGSRQTW